jgi:hypothetical protein
MKGACSCGAPRARGRLVRGRLVRCVNKDMPGSCCLRTAACDRLRSDASRRRAVRTEGFTNSSAYSGTQFVEIMSDPTDIMYADIATVPGSVLVFSFAHRGRCGGMDVTFLKVGPTGGVQTVLSTAAGSNSKWVTYAGACPLSHAAALRARCSSVRAAARHGRLRVGISARTRACGGVGP